MIVRTAIQALEAERNGRAYQGTLSLSEVEMFARIPEVSWLLGKAKSGQISSAMEKLRAIFPHHNVPMILTRSERALRLTPDLSGSDPDTKLRVHAAFTDSGWELAPSDGDSPRGDDFRLPLFKVVV